MTKRVSVLTPGQKLSSILLKLINCPSGIPVDAIRREYELSDRTFRNYLYELQGMPELIGDDGEPLIVQDKNGEVPHLKLRTGVLGADKSAEFFAAFYLASSLMTYLSGTGIFKPIDSWMATLKKNRIKLPFNHLDKKFHSIAEFPKDYSTKSPILRKIVHAVIDQRRLQVRYQSPYTDHRSHFKNFKPYTLMQYRFGLYVVGAQESKNEIPISLAIERIRSLELHPEKFQYPLNYSPSKYLEGRFGIIRGDKSHQVELIFDKSTVPLVSERKYHKSEKRVVLKNGNLKMSMLVNSIEQLIPWILSYGILVQVVSPPELKERIISEVKGIASLYK